MALGDHKPSPHHQAECRLPALKRVVAIHQADATDAGAKGLFFYRPPLAFVEVATPVKGFPAIVHKAKARPDGATDLYFEVVRSLLGVDSTIEFRLTFGPEQVKAFVDKLDDVTFSFSYSWSNRQVVTGQVTAEATKSVREAVAQVAKNTLDERQRKGQVPVFVGQKNKFERALRVEITRTIRAQHPSLLPMLDTTGAIAAKVFDAAPAPTWEELEGDPKVREHLFDSLKPLVAALEPRPLPAKEKAPAAPDDKGPKEAKERPHPSVGAFFRAAADEEHWLTFGVPPRLDVMFTGNTIVTPLKLPAGRNLVTFKGGKAGLTSGFCWPDTLELLRGKPYLFRQALGGGQVIGFADDPNFRAGCAETQRLLFNAVMFGPGVQAREGEGAD